MLRSRAAISLGSTPTRRGNSSHCRWYSSSTNTKQSAQRGVNRSTEEQLLSKTLLQTSDSALIRTWTFPSSMRDALAIIRAVERKYGLVKEFKFFRDFEVSTNYQVIIKVAFRDPESQKRIPEEAEELRVVLPTAIPDNQPGGIGLADVEEYLSSTDNPLNSPSKSDTASTLKLDNVMANVLEERQTKVESESAERAITCRIQRSNTSFYTPTSVAYYRPPRQDREAIARQFLTWGGFHDFPPIEKNTPLPERDFFMSPKLDHFRMRRCLRRASEYLKVPNPYEYSPEHVPGSVVQTKEVLEDDWEPLSSSPVSQPDDTMSATLEEMQDAERLKWEQLPGPSSSQLKHDVLYTTSEENQERKTPVEQKEPHNASAILPPYSSDTSLDSAYSELSPHTLTDVTEFSSATSTLPSSSDESHSNELAEQLRAARYLARKVAEEQRIHTKQRHIFSSEVPGSDINVQVKGSLLEDSEDVSRQTEVITHSLRSEVTEKRSEKQEGNGIVEKLKYTWKGIF